LRPGLRLVGKLQGTAPLLYYTVLLGVAVAAGAWQEDFVAYCTLPAAVDHDPVVVDVVDERVDDGAGDNLEVEVDDGADNLVEDDGTVAEEAG